MSLILRIDVDKPYGRSKFILKVMSKLREDYWFPAVKYFGYLNHLKKFLLFLSEENISAHIYFRICTLPPRSWSNGSLLDRHKIGLHTEDTRNYESFRKEVEAIQYHFSPTKISSFTKHGSGKLKLGKKHYPPYEPEKYLKWANDIGIPFLFGNSDIMNDREIFNQQKLFYPNMFWIDRINNHTKRFILHDIIDIAKGINIIVIIHPENFIADQQVKHNMKQLILLAKQQSVQWITIV